jgi:DnaJ-class molecular chaperone
MPKNYYIILGIPKTSSQEEIKSAYRRLAKEYHPDYYGKGHSLFQNIQEAYSTLSDPARRRAYDKRSRGAKVKIQKGSSEIVVEPMRRRRQANVEPLRPAQAEGEFGVEPLTQPFHQYRPSFETLFDRFFSNFDEVNQAQSEHPESLNAVIMLTPEQAIRGGHARVKVPAHVRCPSCSGRGGTGAYECWRCGGSGTMNGEYPIVLNYPPGIQDNHEVKLSLERFGMRNLYFTVKFKINDFIY